MNTSIPDSALFDFYVNEYFAAIIFHQSAFNSYAIGIDFNGGRQHGYHWIKAPAIAWVRTAHLL
jgi:hypothetical protein